MITDIKIMWNGDPAPELSDEESLIEDSLIRINVSPSLWPYMDLLLHPTYPQRYKHLLWLVTAPLESVEKWCRAMETVITMYYLYRDMAEGNIDSWILFANTWQAFLKA